MMHYCRWLSGGETYEIKKLKFRNSVPALIYFVEDCIFFFISICDRTNSGMLLIPVMTIFHDGCCYHIETSPMSSTENQWSGFSMIVTSAMKELINPN